MADNIVEVLLKAFRFKGSRIGSQPESVPLECDENGALKVVFDPRQITVPTNLGGTGLTSYSAGDTIYGNASGTLSKLAIGSTGHFKRVASGLPAWSRFGLSNKISPSISADQNDWAPTGLSSASVIRVTATSAGRNITGLSAGSDGDVVIIENIGSLFVTLKAESSSSSAANRFGMINDISLWTGDSVVLEYDSSSTRWRVVSINVGVPSFSAHRTSDQTMTLSAYTKVQFNTEGWDSHGWYDSATNHRFQPLLPGKYLVVVMVYVQSVAANFETVAVIRKNGADEGFGVDTRKAGASDQTSIASKIVSLNGSSDYVEAFCYLSDTANRQLLGSASTSYFQAKRISD